MIDVIADNASGREAPEIASRLRELLAASPLRGLRATVYVGCGSPDLVQAHHSRPHILVPLTTSARPDCLVRAQVATADALLLMDYEEVRRLHSGLSDTPVLVMEDLRQPGLLRHGTPRDSVELDQFAIECPEVIAALTALGRVPARFDFQHMADVVVEAVIVAQGESSE